MEVPSSPFLLLRLLSFSSSFSSSCSSGHSIPSAAIGPEVAGVVVGGCNLTRRNRGRHRNHNGYHSRGRNCSRRRNSNVSCSGSGGGGSSSVLCSVPVQEETRQRNEKHSNQQMRKV